MTLCANPDEEALTMGWLPGGDGDDGWRVALLDGVTMGGGVGISVQNPFLTTNVGAIRLVCVLEGIGVQPVTG